MIYFICLFAAGVVIFPFFIISGQLSASKRHRDKLLNKALSRGHEATATLQRSYAASLDNPRSPVDRMQLGKYQFEYKGNVYNIRLRFDGEPPITVKVYWLSNPKKASTSGSITGSSWPWLVAYLVVFLIAVWIAT